MRLPWLGSIPTSAVAGQPGVNIGAGASSPQGSTASFGLAAMTIDDYEIIKPISRGAFGRVYLVTPAPVLCTLLLHGVMSCTAAVSL